MKKLTLIVLSLALYICANGQVPPPPLDTTATKNAETIDCEKDGAYFIIVEESATFQNGDLDTFINWIAQNLKYPEQAIKDGVQGRVIIQFVVSCKGNVIYPKVVRSVNADLDNEAMRVIINSPKWTPGKMGGNAVNQQITIPISFSMQ